MEYRANEGRYDAMPYIRAGKSGLQLPRISLGIWHNFGHVDRYETARETLRTAFDLGITHVDAANNYGPPPGSAEENLGKALREDFAGYRDELIISTKAGYRMGPGPYGDGGSRKYLISSLDASLKRLGLDYVDIFYHHRPDPDTPLEETMAALDYAVRSGRALYVGISNYGPEDTRRAAQILRGLGTPCVIHQPRYNMLDRHIEEGLLGVLEEEGIGCIVFSPLAQGILTDRYLREIPEDSRAARESSPFLCAESLTPDVMDKVRALKTVASDRGQSMTQLALSWILRDPRITSVLVGASRPEQLRDSVAALEAGPLRRDEIQAIEEILAR